LAYDLNGLVKTFGDDEVMCHGLLYLNLSWLPLTKPSLRSLDIMLSAEIEKKIPNRESKFKVRSITLHSQEKDAF
jgi:hypothetical protein